jgi:predicted lipoprotein with Yx(FWY)xxD motif
MGEGGTMLFVRASFAVAAALISVDVSAQPVDLPIAAATTHQYPPGVQVVATKAGPVYANQQGQTLYGMDMRTVLRAGPDPALYCTGNCTDIWEPLLATPDATPNVQFPKSGGPNAQPPPGFVMPQRAPDWAIIKGPQGPQWVYKGWHMVYTRKGDASGSTSHDGLGNRVWNTLKFVPPVPVIVAPGNVQVKFTDGAYALANGNGHLLFTGSCKAPCQVWRPFPAAMASAGIGEWHVSSVGDTPQWLYRGAPVFVSDETDNVPKGGKVLQP